MGLWATADIFGVVMQLQQSRVGNTLLSMIILPPMEGSFSTSATWYPWSARSNAHCIPAMPPPSTRTSKRNGVSGILPPLYPAPPAPSSPPTGPISASRSFMACTSFRKGLVQTVQMATSFSRRGLIPRSFIRV